MVMPKYYAVMLADEAITAFAAASLAEAVEIKNSLQARYNKEHNSDEVFALRESSAAEVRAFVDQATHFVSDRQAPQNGALTMSEFDPFPREPKTFLRFYQKTRGDLFKHAHMLHIITDAHAAELLNRKPAELSADELRRLGRDIARAINLLELGKELIEQAPQQEN
jgi:hypothetical protein